MSPIDIKNWKKPPVSYGSGQNFQKKNFKIFFKIFFHFFEKKISKILTPSIWYRWLFSIFYVNWGHLWEIMFNKLHQKVPWQNFFFLVKIAIFSTLESNFSKGCAPMGVKIYFPNFSTKKVFGPNTFQKYQIPLQYK